jgi:hypothetical protein
MLGVAQGELYRLMQERARAAELQRIGVSCSHGVLVLENRGDAPRRVRAERPVIHESHGLLFEEPEAWKANFDREEERLLRPGERVALRYATTPGVCEEAAGSFTLTPGLLRPSRSCALSFQLSVGDVQQQVSCRPR